MGALAFSIEARARQGKARRGVLRTPHGDIQTPAFVAVGTKATVKGVSVPSLREIGVQTIIANTYHLHLQPGADVVAASGGLHAFMGWDGPLLTDSGGFQVFSLGAAYGKKVSKILREDLDESSTHASVYDPDVASQHGKLAQIDEEGVSFTSHLDGSLHRFTPERSVEIQHKLGADIFFAFDECTAPTETYEYQREAMERTHRWARRSLTAHRQDLDASRRQAIFGIAQGGRFDDLRRESAKTIGEMGFDGFGLGGSFSRKYGENSLESALEMLELIPPELPVHGLGVGEPEDIALGIRHGVDLFDCVQPTRLARTGTVYGPEGVKLQLTNAEFVQDWTPIDSACGCPVCATYSRAYLAHLFRAHEMLGATLASMHNLWFLTKFVERLREEIG